MKQIQVQQYAMKLAFRYRSGFLSLEKYEMMMAKLDTWVLMNHFGKGKKK